MSNVTAAQPRKAMSDIECQFLKIAGEELAKVKMGGPAALATLLTIIASWHSSRLQIGFHDYGQRWLLEGNAKNIVADRLLRDLFGLSDPDPRKAA
ncbi:hypothetical protein [Pseudomonas bohemica]|uniref:hypothetical protein n=1 Tax=Pseudomonas bohemica TaxID=2044872 RepID=UPI000DA6368F|nr:hypothetical protein [Pseudomonas bohemica]